MAKKERNWKNKSYWNMTKDSLKTIIEDRGIKDIDTENRNEMVEALLAYDKNKGEVAEAGVENDLTGKEEEMPKEVPLVKVQFHNVREGEPPYVFLGHNGKSFYIPKEVPVIVPEFLLKSVVKDAIEHRLQPVVKSNGNIEYKATAVQRFPYSYIEKVDREQLKKLKE